METPDCGALEAVRALRATRETTRVGVAWASRHTCRACALRRVLWRWGFHPHRPARMLVAGACYRLCRALPVQCARMWRHLYHFNDTVEDDARRGAQLACSDVRGGLRELVV